MKPFKMRGHPILGMATKNVGQMYVNLRLLPGKCTITLFLRRWMASGRWAFIKSVPVFVRTVKFTVNKSLFNIKIVKFVR